MMSHFQSGDIERLERFELALEKLLCGPAAVNRLSPDAGLAARPMNTTCLPSGVHSGRMFTPSVVSRVKVFRSMS